MKFLPLFFIMTLFSVDLFAKSSFSLFKLTKVHTIGGVIGLIVGVIIFYMKHKDK